MQILTRQKGFSLIELAIIILVVGTITLGITLVWPGDTISLESQAKLLTNDIRLAQLLSMTKFERYKINFISTTQYQIEDSSGNIYNYRDRSQSPYTLKQGIEFQSTPANITFNSLGVPYDDAGNPITGTPDLNLIDPDGNNYEIELQRVSGGVEDVGFL